MYKDTSENNLPLSEDNRASKREHLPDQLSSKKQSCEWQMCEKNVLIPFILQIQVNYV